MIPGQGVPGDRWSRRHPLRIEAEITLMRADIARLVGNGQPLSAPGDNLLVDLDLSIAHLPAGTVLRAGTTLLEVTPLPHTGCVKFERKFGRDAVRLTADPRFRHLRLRGIHARIIGTGEIAPGDLIEVVQRG
jgi:MOSC domain-containing protein YiiM